MTRSGAFRTTRGGRRPLATRTCRRCWLPRPIRPRSRPCTAATWTASTGTPSTSLATTTMRRTRPSASSWPPCAPSRNSVTRGRPSGLGCSASRTTPSPMRTAAALAGGPSHCPTTSSGPPRMPTPRDRSRWPTSSARSGAWSPQMPDDRRQVILLRFVDDLSTAEIAEVLDRSPGAVRVLLHRSLRDLAARLDARG